MINQIKIDKAIIEKIEERVRLLPGHVKQNRSNCRSSRSDGSGCSIRVRLLRCNYQNCTDLCFWKCLCHH
ncbi:hypothetical protein Hanom_Chr01g00007181 [Helianthus anomalus]